MANVRTNTGGRMEFGDAEPKGDTEHTAKFKEAYKNWLNKPKKSSWKKSLKSNNNEPINDLPTKMPDGRCDFKNCQNIAHHKACKNCKKYFCDDHRHPEFHDCESKSSAKKSTKKFKFWPIFVFLIIVLIILQLSEQADLFELGREKYSDIQNWFKPKAEIIPDTLLVPPNIIKSEQTDEGIIETAEWMFDRTTLTTIKTCEDLTLGKAANELSKQSLYMTFCRKYCEEAERGFTGSYECNQKNNLECGCE
jgi:hypothetical protein